MRPTGYGIDSGHRFVLAFCTAAFGLAAGRSMRLWAVTWLLVAAAAVIFVRIRKDRKATARRTIEIPPVEISAGGKGRA